MTTQKTVKIKAKAHKNWITQTVWPVAALVFIAWFFVKTNTDKKPVHNEKHKNKAETEQQQTNRIAQSEQQGAKGTKTKEKSSKAIPEKHKPTPRQGSTTKPSASPLPLTHQKNSNVPHSTAKETIRRNAGNDLPVGFSGGAMGVGSQLAQEERLKALNELPTSQFNPNPDALISGPLNNSKSDTHITPQIRTPSQRDAEDFGSLLKKINTRNAIQASKKKPEAKKTQTTHKTDKDNPAERTLPQIRSRPHSTTKKTIRRNAGNDLPVGFSRDAMKNLPSAPGSDKTIDLIRKGLEEAKLTEKKWGNPKKRATPKAKKP